MTDGPIRLVLDASAVWAYAAGAIGVGEPIAEVVDEGARFGVPVLCLVQAVQIVGAENAARLDVLTSHVGCVVLPMLAEQWRPVAAVTAQLGRADLAVALVEALRHDGYVLSAEAEQYDPDGEDDLPVIAVNPF